AFDTVDHQTLINRLQDLIGQSGPVLKWFSSYLTGRSFSVSANNTMSEPASLQYGVPQGSVLGPLLFLLYLLPLGQIIQQFSDVSYLLFADDLQLVCSFKPSEAHKLSSLINCLSLIKQWLRDNSLQLNPSTKTEFRNLGVIFDHAMSLDHHSGLLVRTCFFQLRNIAKFRHFDFCIHCPAPLE
uniref:Reverse transcriptase domain-containing protein n=1 Tax=Salarias fasciatus TaxID=181472 RepID=A0A672GZP5_SALFA